MRERRRVRRRSRHRSAEDADLDGGHRGRCHLEARDDRFGAAQIKLVGEQIRQRGVGAMIGIRRRQHLRVRHRPHQIGDRRRDRPDRLQRPLGRGRGTGVGDHHHRHQAPVVLGRHERQRGSAQDVDDQRQLVGRCGGLLDQGCDHPGPGGQDERSARELVEPMQPQLQPGDDAEVAPTAANRPEQIGIPLGVGAQDLAARRHDLRREQVVDRHPMLADQVADAAPERQPADPDAPRVAEPGGESVGPSRLRVLAGRQAGLRPGGWAHGIDLEAAHRREVDHDATVDGCVPRGAVAATADGEVEARSTCKPDRL